VQVDPIKPTLKAPVTKRLKLESNWNMMDGFQALLSISTRTATPRSGAAPAAAPCPCSAPMERRCRSNL